MMSDDDGGGGGGDQGASDQGGNGDTGGSGSSDQPPVNHFQSMPDDWRTQAVKTMGIEEGSPDFDKRVKQLERVSDFSVFGKNYFESMDKIRSGMVESGLPENPSDEQLAEYREANGIPTEPGGYELNLDEGLVLGEEDERIMKGVYDVAYANNVPSESVNAMTNALLQGRQQEMDARISQDGVDKQTSDRQLKDAWGGDFETNLNSVKGLINSLPASIKEGFMDARTPDGRAIFNSPELMVAFAEWQRKIDPSATVVPNVSNPIQSMNDEIKSLEDRMGDEDWHKDLDSQKRYQDLVNARDSMMQQAS
jgi:hypothetical protein